MRPEGRGAMQLYLKGRFRVEDTLPYPVKGHQRPEGVCFFHLVEKCGY